MFTATATWPTFGEMLDYLRGFGFTTRPGKPGSLVAEHPQEPDTWFIFFDRGPDTPAREVELLDLKTMLPARGFVTDQEYARFWSPYNPARQPDPYRQARSSVTYE